MDKKGIGGWGAALIAKLHEQGDHRACATGCSASGRKTRETSGPPGYRSKTEENYAALLEEQRSKGEIIRWSHEPIRLKIGVGAYYTPDFAVWRQPGRDVPELHEVKGGFVREAARVRFRAAVLAWPCFRWFWVVGSGGLFQIEECK